MAAVPAVMPEIVPVAVSIVAIAVCVLLQEPPLVASLRAVLFPAHTCIVPVIAGGSGFTVTTPVAGAHTSGREKVIVAVPGNSPATMPVIAPTVAIAVLLQLQLPPLVPSDNVAVVPAQMVKIPEIVVGVGLTVIVATAGQIEETK